MKISYDEFEGLVASKLKDKGNFRVKDYWHSGKDDETTAVVVQEVVDGKWSYRTSTVLGLDEVAKLLGADKVDFNDDGVVVSTKTGSTLGWWFDHDGEVFMWFLDQWLEKHEADPCRCMAYTYATVKEFRDSLDTALSGETGWARWIGIGPDRFEDGDPRASFRVKDPSDIVQGVLDWVDSDFSGDVFSGDTSARRGEILTALFWCTGCTDGADGIDLEA